MQPKTASSRERTKSIKENLEDSSREIFVKSRAARVTSTSDASHDEGRALKTGEVPDRRR
jgi:hypothetical protein